MTLNRTPIFNLGAALKETGLAADTLRAWERRYGVPKPKRTPGGHRLYSERDIQTIKWLVSRQAEGLSISRAVEQWKKLIAAGNDPLAEQNEMIVPAGTRPSVYGNLDAFRDQWLDACLRFDEAAAEQVLNQAYMQYSVEAVTAGVIEGALREVGEMWQRGEATVQQEHFLSTLTTRRLDALIAVAPPPMHAPVIVLACAQGEPHALPLLYLNLLLRRHGYKVIFLGADVPTAEITETAQTVKAALVVLSAEQLVTAAVLKDEAALLAKKHIPVAFGGRIFAHEPELQKRIAGTYLGDEINSAVDRIKVLLNEPAPETRRIPSGLVMEARAFREARPRIESGVQQHFAKSPLPSRLLAIANSHFGPGIAAALELGNVKYLETDLNWIHTLLAGHGLPLRSLRDYLLAYANTFRRVMGSSAADITNWIQEYASRL